MQFGLKSVQLILRVEIEHVGINSGVAESLSCYNKTRPAWAGFKTAEEGRAKICKFLWQKLKNKSNFEKHIMNNCRTLLKQFYNSLRAFLELF